MTDFQDCAVPVSLKGWFDALTLLIGDRLAQGAHRHVYIYFPDSDNYVLKYEWPHCPKHNVAEWLIWNELQDTKFARWLAPCKCISPDGRWLLQRRTAAPRTYPKKVPALFNFDLKLQNWGMLWPEGRVVCHDYANINLFGGASMKRLDMQVADWWELWRNADGFTIGRPSGSNE